jgi:hypothetical protein
MDPEILFSARTNKWRKGRKHSSSGMLPVSVFPLNINSASKGMFLVISFGKDPKNLLFSSESVFSPVQFRKTEDKSAERLLLLNSRIDSEGIEHMEVGIPPDRMLWDKSMICNLCIPTQNSGISSVR